MATKNLFSAPIAHGKPIHKLTEEELTAAIRAKVDHALTERSIRQACRRLRIPRDKVLPYYVEAPVV